VLPWGKRGESNSSVTGFLGGGGVFMVRVVFLGGILKAVDEINGKKVAELSTAIDKKP